MSIQPIGPGGVALVTGGASGIGLAACRAFARAGMAVVLVDHPGPALEAAEKQVAADAAAGYAGVLAIGIDVTSRPVLRAMEQAVRARFGRIDLLMANAAVQPGSDVLGRQADWDRVLAVNLHGAVDTVRTVLPAMIGQATTGLVIVTGSKQGITTPPGDPAYNVAKAGLKAFTEALQHDLRNRPDCRVSAHLLIPGFVFTGLTANGRTKKPAAAWTPEQTVDFLLERLTAGDFYILCPDNDVDRATDEKRILWAAGDIVENRPPLSRWHPDHADAFSRFLRP